jgi:hypothetical protein
MQYDKTGSSEKKLITEKLVPRKFQFCEQLDKVITHIFGIQRSNQFRLEKGAKGPFSVLLPRKFSRAELH